MKSKFKKLLATALVLCLVLALLPAAAFADGNPTFSYFDITQYKEVNDGNSFVGGTVSVSENTLTIAPDENYGIRRAQLKYDENKIVSIPITTADAELTYDIDTTQNATTIQVQVGFKPFHTVTCDSASEKNISVNSNSVMEGDWVIVTPNANMVGATLDYVWYQYEGQTQTRLDKNLDGEYKFQMGKSNVTVGAEYTPIVPPTTEHYIDCADKITGGEIWSSANSAKAGETVYIYVDPDWGWMTDDVYYTTSEGAGIIVPWKQYLTHEYWLDTQSYEVWSFVMPNHDVYVYADFTYYDDYGTYYIDTSYDSTLGGVEVWVNNNYVGNNWHQGSWADYKDSVSFKVKPYYSDDVVSVSVVGKRTGWTYSYDYNSYSGWYTFTMPNEDVTINVDFRSGVHKVYVDKVTDGKLTVSDDWAKYGQIVYITAVPDYGCTLSSLSVRTATGDSVHVYNAQKADTYYFYMPDQYVSVSAVFTGKYTSLPFNDVSYGDWYYNAVQFVYSKGIMDGVDYYKFAPNGTITRGMIVTMLWRMAGEPFEMPVTSFTDVEIGRYYTTAVAWACRNGIADGMGESTFGPNDAITREELVTLLYRYAQYFGHSCIGTSIEGFADAGSVSSYAYNAMCWAYKAGVVTGTTGSRLNPQGTASRAEAAQMIMSFYSFLNS